MKKIKDRNDFCWEKCFDAKSRQPDFGLPTFAFCSLSWLEVVKGVDPLKKCPYMFERGVAAGMEDAE